MDFVWFLLIGAAAGWLAGQIMKGSGFGMLGNIEIELPNVSEAALKKVWDLITRD